MITFGYNKDIIRTFFNVYIMITAFSEEKVSKKQGKVWLKSQSR